MEIDLLIFKAPYLGVSSYTFVCPYLVVFSKMFIQIRLNIVCSEADSRSSQVKGIRAKKRCAVTTPTAYTGEAT